MAKNDNQFLWLDSTGSSEFNIVDLKKVEDALLKKAAQFQLNVAKKIREKQLIASGNLLSDKSFKAEVRVDGSKKELLLYMIYYGDFVNKGVKGWGSTKKAPNSPYKYKTKGMDAQGRESISNYLKTARGRVRNVQYEKQKLETKVKDEKSKIQSATDRAVWNIKKYGIKATNFYTEAFEETFKDLGAELNEALGQEIVVNLIQMNNE